VPEAWWTAAAHRAPARILRPRPRGTARRPVRATANSARQRGACPQRAPAGALDPKGTPRTRMDRRRRSSDAAVRRGFSQAPEIEAKLAACAVLARRVVSPLARHSGVCSGVPPVWGSCPHPVSIGRFPHFLARRVVARADTWFGRTACANENAPTEAGACVAAALRRGALLRRYRCAGRHGAVQFIASQSQSFCTVC
jgi:hypothetical protein